MTDFTFEVVVQTPDEIDLNINWDNFNTISISVSKEDLEELRSEIESALKELEELKCS